MVRNSKIINKNAFTLIELIFAIVVIAISVMSLPMMTRVTTAGIESNLVQEAIFASVAEINMATTYIWDENSLIDEDDVTATKDSLSRVIDVDGTECPNITPDPITGLNILRRAGHVNRRCIDNADTRVYVGTGTDFQDALETPEHNTFSPAFEGAGSSKTAQKQDYESKLEVNYATGIQMQFGNTANDPNIKELTLTIRNEKQETITVLRTYSANIGEVAYARRDIP